MRGRWVPVAAVLAATVAAGASGVAASADQTLRAAPANVTPPAITGKPRVGQTLSASQGEWQGEPSAFFYQWLRCDAAGENCAPIAGAIQPTYTLTEADVGSRIRVEVVAQNADGASPPAQSRPTRVVRVAVPTLLSAPTVSGEPVEGETLTASPGEWSGSPTSFEYTWKRCRAGHCTNVPGAVAQTYALTGADIGSRIRVRVVARNAGGRSAPARSKSTAPVRPAASLFEIGKPTRDRKRGLARFRVTVATAGTLTLRRTAKVRGQTRRAAGPGVVKLTVKPRGQAKRKLRRRGKVRVRAWIEFAPDGGAPVTKSKRVRLRLRR